MMRAMDDAKERAEKRRETWSGGHATHSENWSIESAKSMTPEQRLEATLEMAMEWLMMRGADESAFRLCRSATGVRRVQR